MTVIRLPSGNKINFGNADQETIKKALQGMKEKRPELFQEAEPKFATDIFAKADRQKQLQATQTTEQQARIW